MDTTDLEKRKARAATETLVIAVTEGGYRVYNPANITHLYMVTGIPESPKCNCPDFQTHECDADWRCKHILAVLNKSAKGNGVNSESQVLQQPSEKEVEPKPSEVKKPKTQRNAQAQMLIKRSVSPDGRIDSLSVEFISAIELGTDETIKLQAHRALFLQAEITDEFLKRNGNGHSKAQPTVAFGNGSKPNGAAQGSGPQERNGNGTDTDGTVPAQLLNIASMNTRSGWRTFINVQVNGTATKLFGDKQELEQVVSAAGFPDIAHQITQGMLLNLPCRVVTRRSQDGKYLNIEKVMPAKPLDNNGRAGQ